MSGESFDRHWEEKYAAGHTQRYPWDTVVSFVFQNAPRDRERSEVRILEVGCGTGANLWFAGREGFSVTGIDASESAIATAQAWLSEENIKAELRIADFTALPFEDATFDLIVDRAALTCCGRDAMKTAIAEIARVAKPGAKFLFTPYADSHSSVAGGTLDEDGTVRDITSGAVAGAGQIYFVSRREIPELLGECWEISEMARREEIDLKAPSSQIHSEWKIVAVRR